MYGIQLVRYSGRFESFSVTWMWNNFTVDQKPTDRVDHAKLFFVFDMDAFSRRDEERSRNGRFWMFFFPPCSFSKTAAMILCMDD